jgi:hypothetical protein
MIRKQIYLEPAQNTALKRLAQQAGVSEAELIRAAIDQHLQTGRRLRPNPALWDEEFAFLERLAQQPFPAATRIWRRDDLYER